MHKSALSRLSLKLILAVLVVHFLLFWASKYGTFWSSLTGVLIFILPPLVLPWLVLKTKPAMSLGGVLLLIPLFAFCYHDQFIAPYTGGGAKMTYVLTWIAGIPLSALGMMLTPVALKLFGIQIPDDGV